MLVTVGAEHPVDSKVRSDFANEFDVIHGDEPVGIVDKDDLAVTDVEDAFHLLGEAADIILDRFRRHDGAHIRAI